MTEPVIPAPVRLFDLIVGAWVSQAITTATELGVPDELAGGPRSAEYLAKAAGTGEPALYRLLRALSTGGVLAPGIVTELDGRRFALTELGELLRTDHPDSMRGWALLHGRPFHREVWAGLTESVRTGGSTYDAVTGRTLFDHFAEHPEDAAVLNDAMTSMSRTIVLSLAEAYDYGPFGTVVDVGGGQGALLAAILTRHPGSAGILYDLPHVVAGARRSAAVSGLGGRLECRGGDFFDTVPAGGDAYVLCNVVHDWGDDEAIRILANCKVAMNTGGRVLLGEFVLSEGPGNDPMQTWADLAMLVMTSGGRQRTRGEVAELLHRAGLRLSRVIPAANGFSVVEGVPV